MSLDELKSRIVSLNIEKNEYATKKVKGELSETDEKNLVSSLIYVISELKQCAKDCGISDDGKFIERTKEIEDLNHLNESVKNLKSQILFLVNSSVKDIKKEMNIQSDTHKVQQQNEKDTSDAKNRLDSIRDRLQKKLNDN